MLDIFHKKIYDTRVTHEYRLDNVAPIILCKIRSGFHRMMLCLILTFEYFLKLNHVLEFFVKMTFHSKIA